jgi:hypothetical protein
MDSMKKSFTAPFWFLFLFGVFRLGFAIFPLAEGRANRLVPTDSGYYLITIVIFIESFVYWMIRAKNKQRRASRAHVYLWVLALVTPFLGEAAFVFYDNFTPTADISGYIKAVNYTCLIGLPVLSIAAHVFFIIVLMKTFQGPSVKPKKAAGEHLLDDVLD